MTELKTKCCPSCGGSGSAPADTVGKQLMKLREQAGVRPTAMHTALNISPAYLYDLERDRRRWTNELVASYMKKLEALKGE